MSKNEVESTISFSAGNDGEIYLFYNNKPVIFPAARQAFTLFILSIMKYNKKRISPDEVIALVERCLDFAMDKYNGDKNKKGGK